MDRKEKDILMLIFEMIRNSRRSDRELARSLRVSQPTVTRKRTIIEKEGYIKEYTVVPDLVKLGYDFIAVTFLSFAEDKPELFDKAREWTKNQSSVLFAADGQGLGMNSIMVSAHKSYGDFSNLITKLRQDWQPNLRQVESFTISLAKKERFIKDFSFRYLEKKLVVLSCNLNLRRNASKPSARYENGCRTSAHANGKHHDERASFADCAACLDFATVGLN